MLITETKICKQCNQDKELTEYYVQKKTKNDGTEWIYYNPICKECIKEKSLKRHYEHKEEYNARSKQWYAKNKEKVLEEKKIYILDKKDQYAAVQKEWRENNKDKTKEYNLKYKQKQFKLSKNEWGACKKYFNNSCAYCGISDEDAKQKYKKGLHKEHAINEGENDLSNCLPACTGCNSTKNKEDYTTWYTLDNPIYDQDKLNVIKRWLNEDYITYKITI